MHKFIALIPRRDDRSREFFRQHYEARHAPLAIAHIEHFQFKKYVRNHFLESLSGTEPNFDVISEFWYADMSALETVDAFLAAPESKVIHDDEDHFMNNPKVRSSKVHEHLIGGEPRSFDAEPVDKLSIALRRSPAVAAADFISAARTAAAELAAQPAASRVILDEVSAGDALLWDAFVHVWLTGAASDIAVPPALWQHSTEHFVTTCKSYESTLPD